MPYLPKTTARRPWVPAPTPPKPYQQHRARTADYDSPRWKALRKELLSRQPVCAVPGCQKPTKVADHVTPVRLGGDFWSLGNLQGMCWSCHSRKSQSERFLKKE